MEGKPEKAERIWPPRIVAEIVAADIPLPSLIIAAGRIVGIVALSSGTIAMDGMRTFPLAYNLVAHGGLHNSTMPKRERPFIRNQACEPRA